MSGSSSMTSTRRPITRSSWIPRESTPGIVLDVRDEASTLLGCRAVSEIDVGHSKDLGPGEVTGAGKWAVGNSQGDLFAVTRRCRHLYADLAGGSIDRNGCLVCPWHRSKYDVKTGRMVRGPQGVFAKIPGLGTVFKALTRVVPLGRGKVETRDGKLYVRD